MKRLVAILMGLILTSAASAAPPADFPGIETIRGDDLMKTVTYLAAPDLQGRLAGSPGFMKAARMMADRFEKLGLKPAGEDGCFQKLPVEYNEIATCRLGVIQPDGSTRWLKLGPDFTARGLTGSGDITAPVVFVGYGLSRPESGYDDYAGIDAKGRIVLAFKEAPSFTADSTGWGESYLARPKGLVAAAHGALALLVVPVPNQPHPQKPIASMLEGEGSEDQNFPRLQVDDSVADDLLRTAGMSLKGMQSLIDSTKAPHPIALGVSMHVTVAAHYVPDQPSVNVVGMIPGSEPRLAGQCVVIGAHLDHVGSQGEIYFPGANDNASGSASVAAIAEAFAKSGARPKRTVIFALFTSEESGLFGSKHFVEHPPLPADSIVAYLNLDCVGHGDSIEVHGGKATPKLWQIARDLDQQGVRLMVNEMGNGGGADAAPFHSAGIPTLYFASKFSYTHLHLPTDTPATLNPPLLEAIARLAGETAWVVADGGYDREAVKVEPHAH